MTQPSVLQVNGDDSGALYTVKLNEVLSANTTLFAGPSAPSITVPHMIWQDTSSDPPTEYRRNATNSGWVSLGKRENGDFVGNVTGSASTCSKLATPRAIAISGAGTGSTSFDGSANATINLTLNNSGVTAGSYGSTTQIPVVTVNSKGLVTGMSYVTNPTSGGFVTSWNGRQGAVSLTAQDLDTFSVFDDYVTRPDVWIQGPIVSQNWGTTGPNVTLYNITNLLATWGRGVYLVHVIMKDNNGFTDNIQTVYNEYVVNDSIPPGQPANGFLGLGHQTFTGQSANPSEFEIVETSSHNGKLMGITGFTLKTGGLPRNLDYINLRVWRRTY